MKEIDRQEAQRLVDTYADPILRLSYTYLHSTHDAEDICQTVFLKLLTGRHPDFDSPAHERAWVLRAAANACRDELRSARRKNLPLDAAAEAQAPALPSSEVLEAVLALPRNYREAIYLHYYEGYSIQEAAKLLRRSPAAVAAHLSRGRKKLRTILGGHTDG